MTDLVVRHLDANVIADFSRGRERRVIERMKATETSLLAISVIAMGELLVGAEKSGDPRVLVEVRTVLARIPMIGVDETTAIRYADVRARLERMGQRMSDNDLWIAATALAHNAVLVTADEAFARVSNLKTENWRI